MSVVGKLYGRVLIKRDIAGTECAIGEEQYGFRQQGIGCMDEVFVVRQVCEKYLANGKNVFWVFMDLEKEYDTTDRYGMWQMLRVHGVGLLKAVQSFYVFSRGCIQVGIDMDVSEWFPVNVGLRGFCDVSMIVEPLYKSRCID